MWRFASGVALLVAGCGSYNIQPPPSTMFVDSEPVALDDARLGFSAHDVLALVDVVDYEVDPKAPRYPSNYSAVSVDDFIAHAPFTVGPFSDVAAFVDTHPSGEQELRIEGALAVRCGRGECDTVGLTCLNATAPVPEALRWSSVLGMTGVFPGWEDDLLEEVEGKWAKAACQEDPSDAAAYLTFYGVPSAPSLGLNVRMCSGLFGVLGVQLLPAADEP